LTDNNPKAKSQEKRAHLDTTTGTPDLSGSGPCGSSGCRINPAFRLTSLSLCVVEEATEKSKAGAIHLRG